MSFGLINQSTGRLMAVAKTRREIYRDIALIDLAAFRPVERARQIIKMMEGCQRAEILDLCEESGINRGTAATQLAKLRNH